MVIDNNTRTARLVGAAVIALWAATTMTGCGDTGQQRVDYPLRVGGDPRARSFDAFGWQIDLTRAELAFGPLYLCASEGASADLCETARAELLSAGLVDLLDGREREIGRIAGISGGVRSSMYDFGITWTNTQLQPTPLAGAPGGHSLRVEGRASRSATTRFAFSADIDLVPPGRGFRTVQGRRVRADVDDSDTALVVSFDVAAWLSQIDWDALAQLGQDPLRIAPDSKAANAVIVAITASAPPAFRWIDAPAGAGSTP